MIILLYCSKCYFTLGSFPGSNLIAEQTTSWLRLEWKIWISGAGKAIAIMCCWVKYWTNIFSAMEVALLCKWGSRFIIIFFSIIGSRTKKSERECLLDLPKYVRFFRKILSSSIHCLHFFHYFVYLFWLIQRITVFLKSEFPTFFEANSLILEANSAPNSVILLLREFFQRWVFPSWR